MHTKRWGQWKRIVEREFDRHRKRFSLPQQGFLCWWKRMEQLEVSSSTIPLYHTRTLYLPLYRVGSLSLLFVFFFLSLFSAWWCNIISFPLSCLFLWDPFSWVHLTILSLSTSIHLETWGVQLSYLEFYEQCSAMSSVEWPHLTAPFCISTIRWPKRTFDSNHKERKLLFNLKWRASFLDLFHVAKWSPLFVVCHSIDSSSLQRFFSKRDKSGKNIGRKAFDKSAVGDKARKFFQQEESVKRRRKKREQEGWTKS